MLLPRSTNQTKPKSHYEIAYFPVLTRITKVTARDRVRNKKPVNIVLQMCVPEVLFSVNLHCARIAHISTTGKM